jgi:hypothetical protein
MNTAMQIAQLSYDNRLPPEDDGFLETEEGQEWLTASVDDLLNRRDIKAPNAIGKEKMLVSVGQLNEAVDDHMSSRIDPGRCVAQILIALIRRGADSSLYGLAVRAVGGEKVVTELARSLLADRANEYRDAKRESDRIERECGF